MAIEIINPAPRARLPLYHCYPCQNRAQDAYLELDCEDGTVYADWNGEIGNAIPESVYNNRTLRFGLPNRMKRREVVALLKKAAPIAEKIVAGFEVENQRGYFDDAAKAAIDEMERLCHYAFDDFDDWDYV